MRMITSSNIVEFFELYLRPFLEQESRLTKELAADEALRCMTIRLCAAWTATRQPDGFVQYEKKLKRKHLPIIALTANVFAEDSERGAACRNGRPHGQARGDAAASGDDDALDRITCSRKHWIG